mgnify:CR=1 FL=1
MERDDRIQRLETLRKEGIDPYPAQSNRTHTVAAALLDFEKLAEAKTSLTLTGRLKSRRAQGKACFADLEDESGKLQLFARADELSTMNYELLTALLDIGDIIQATGILFTTKKGEKTLQLSDIKILTKSLLPLPEKWHGLEDVEVRFRQRYLDLIANPEVREIFRKKSRMITAVRDFFNKKGYLEVDTPILQPLAGGATARPFITHHNALNTDLYLRIAPELYLKRLLVGGFEKIYEISRCFRNEGIDRSHNPEFTQVEFYEAYRDYTYYMTLIEEFMAEITTSVTGSTKVNYEDTVLDFTPPYPRRTYREVIQEYAHIDINDYPDRNSLAQAAETQGVKIAPEWGRGEIMDELFKKVAGKHLVQPTFIIDHPIELSPLTKKKQNYPQFVERFQLVVKSMEIVNTFSELNDPLDQRARFEEQEKLRGSGNEEAQRLDEDFLTALEHGMPPAAGCGIGLDRLATILTGVHSIKEIILFPTLKPK